MLHTHSPRHNKRHTKSSKLPLCRFKKNYKEYKKEIEMNSQIVM